MTEIDDMTFMVSELFTSLQGETTHSGRLCSFIRLAGCNLDCAYCDTSYARQPADGRSMALREIMDFVVAAKVPLVEVTGGEPLSHKGTPVLCAALMKNGFEVMVETNGSLPVTLLPDGVAKIVDSKCPSSGETARMLSANFAALGPRDEVKFVICDRGDFDYAVEFSKQHRLPERVGAVLFSPVTGKLAPQILAEWMLKERAPARLQLQLHKIIWGPHTRGV